MPKKSKRSRKRYANIAIILFLLQAILIFISKHKHISYDDIISQITMVSSIILMKIQQRIQLKELNEEKRDELKRKLSALETEGPLSNISIFNHLEPERPLLTPEITLNPLVPGTI